MKKSILYVAAAALALSLLSACGGAASSVAPSKAPSTAPSAAVSKAVSAAPPSVANTNEKVAAIFAKLEAVTPVNTPKAIDDNTLKLLMNVNPENVAAYKGQITQVNQNTDRILVIEAKPGKVEAVKQDLLNHQKDLVNMAAAYKDFADEKAKAEKAVIVTNGNYAVMVVNASAQKSAEVIKEALK